MSRKIIGIITAITGDRVIVENEGLAKGFGHLHLPDDILLELLERILKDPSDIFLEQTNERLQHYIFYRREHTRYLLAVVKRIPTGSFLCTMHTSGKKIRNKHQQLEKIK